MVLQKVGEYRTRIRINGSEEIDTLQSSDRIYNVASPHGNLVLGDGSDGSISQSSTTTQNGLYQVSDYTVESGVTVNVTDRLVIVSQGTVEINGTISATGANSGNGSLFAPGGDGGDGGSGDDGSSGGGFTSTTYDPQTMTSYLLENWDLWEDFSSTLPYGAGGGDGGTGRTFDGDNTNSGGAGGGGGGGVAIIAPKIIGSGAVRADGEDGEDGEDSLGFAGGGGGGGGGCGGIVLLNAGIELSSNISYSATKGFGGNGGGGGPDVPPGGDGTDGVAGISVALDAGVRQ